MYPSICPRRGTAGSGAASVQQCFLLSRCHHLKGLSSGEHAEEGRDLKCPLAQARASSLLTCAHQLQNYPVSLKPCMLSGSFACIDSPSPCYYQFYMRMAHGKQRRILSMHNTRPLHKCRVEPNACYHRLYSSIAPHDLEKFQMNIYLLRGLWREPW